MSKSINEYLDEQERKDCEGRVTLKAEQIIELQNKVRHFLNSYEVENKLNASEMAKILGYTPMHYSRFKLVGTFNKVASSILFFSNFAQLRKMSLSEFIIDIENRRLKNPDGQLSREMWDWEIEMLEIFSKIDSTIRRVFTKKVIKDSESYEVAFCKLEIGLSILILLSQMKINDFKLATTIFKEISIKSFKSNEAQDNNEEAISELQNLRTEFIKIIKNKNSSE
ncbi:hypothetical protein [Fluviispira sanaruensis]|uniref:Uncharacterized protein n=1 Tax=Fluviispira sanaruensis TaxID=2493639 RepID=A0A4P2VNK4_FLUSA|nr:hypothetical protein [Fluviispira sanaruensis]BBH54701.1 hypothetical protein JCM31447_31750 [Fluviispira sanaruensis]